MGLNKSGAGDVFLTPRAIVEALGPFDLDPCDEDCLWAHQNPTSLCFMSLPENIENLSCSECYCGIHSDWSQFGIVWLNPPFSNIRPFLEKLIAHEPGGIALLPAATDTAWFQDLVLPYATIKFLRGRLKFHVVDGSQLPQGIGRPLLLAGFGEEAVKRIRSIDE